MIEPPKQVPPRSIKPQRLDGRPPPRPNGRQAKPDEPPREAVPLKVTQRLGYRIAEFAALTGVSVPTIWRGVKAGKIVVIDHCGVPIIPRAYAIERGFITADDHS